MIRVLKFYAMGELKHMLMKEKVEDDNMDYMVAVSYTHLTLPTTPYV